MGFRRLWMALLLIVSLPPAGKAEAWMEDYELAQAAARQTDRAVFLFFTGSDWCGWCQKLDREVLTTPQFNAFANPNLVLVKIDFPHRTRLPAEQQAQNNALAKRFHIRGYPTVVVLGGDGKVAGELGYMEGGPGPFIEHLQRLPNIKWHPAGSAPSSPAPPIAANSPAPEFNGAPLVAPKRYTQIHLKGIMGTKQRPMVILNDQTFVVGETARVRFKEGQLKVTCKEIKTDSAVVLIEGSREPQEIFLQ